MQLFANAILLCSEPPYTKLLNASQAGEGGLASVHTELAGTLSFTPTLTEDLKSWDLDHEFQSASC